MDEFLPRPRLEEILARARLVRAGVVGDFTLDGYWFADMTRSALSRETPLYPRPVVREQYTCGGAANVAWNLAALGPAEVRAFTVLGSDWRGVLLLRALREAGVDPRDALAAPAWFTPFFGKVILQANQLQQEDARLDFVNTNPLSPDIEAGLLERIEAALPELDVLVVADYQAVGVVSPAVLDGLNALARRFPQVVFAVDSRERVGSFLNMVRKPNEIEAARWLFPGRAPGLVGLDAFAETALRTQVDCSPRGVEGAQDEHGCPLFITFGERGCLVVAGGESHLVPAAPVAPPVDPVGAGDTFLAALALALAAGATPVEAARLGHLAAAVTIRKLGVTGAATPDEVLSVAAGL
jgi:rfaE bifunctional protein kinase chain/domain